jgi:hypothetical protein
LYAGRAAIRPATTLVLPMFRECPPITTMAIDHNRFSAYFELASQRWSRLQPCNKLSVPLSALAAEESVFSCEVEPQGLKPAYLLSARHAGLKACSTPDCQPIVNSLART